MTKKESVDAPSMHPIVHTPGRLHPLEIETREAEPNIGSGDVSKCLPGWIKTFCEKFEAGDGYTMSHAAVNALAHTLIAARARCERLARERDEARNANSKLLDACELTLKKIRIGGNYAELWRVVMAACRDAKGTH
jgi:hypothetical protein